MGVVQDLPRPVKTYHTETYDRISPSKAQFKGKGKTVLITGGATGIGFSIAKSFAEAGISRIIIISRSPGPQAEAKETIEKDFPNTKVEGIQASIADRTRMTEVLSSVAPIDVLVLSAVASHKFAKSVDIPTTDFDESFTVNILACYDLVRTYLRQPAPNSKTVINISSAAAHITLPGQVAYGASKAGFLGIMSAMANEYSPQKDGVRLMSMHPGIILTDLASAVGYGEGDLEWEDEKLPGHFAIWLTGNEAEFLHGRFVWAQWDVDELVQLKKKVEEDQGLLKLGLIM
ncbi:hypothetical protein DOTSEDRAFT_71740 [Dothistroma septosporum NZE10]|uniref:NAD(P)-binding protein n=1 Tax=Dothistroma septosporum (strain NZE10 / CBS 128990) TaxID=675120 RepID=N1PKL6_DOTSN|nr:hypothetical protein DOTSEDRAFT_71740 [Dothistroma septosporum NZE10]